MKINWKSLIISFCLIFVLFLIIYINIGLYISGPTRKYERKIQTQMEVISKKYKNVKNIHRDVFHYIMYIGEGNQCYYWFNEKGKVVDKKEKSTYNKSKVSKIIKDNYNVEQFEIKLGYGYHNPAYRIECEKGTILLDYDTLEEIYYLKKGE